MHKILLSVFLMLVISCITLSAQTFKADTSLILQESEYASFYSKFTKKYRSPYLAIYKKGNKTLVYLAAKHSPETIPSVQYAFDIFKPQIALVEREPNEPFIPCNEGEDGYTAALSAKLQIPLVRADASLEQQWNAAKRAGFSYDDWQAVWLIRTAYYNGLEDHTVNARDAIKDYERRHHNPNWGPLFTEEGLLNYFKTNYQKDFNNMDFVQFFYDLTDVYTRDSNTPFNRLIVNIDHTRNMYMLQNIVQALNQYDTVFVESGSAHYHYLTKALKKMLGKPHYITADQIPPQTLWKECTLDNLQEKVLLTDTGKILTFPANPKAGFEWGYLVYLPDNLDTSNKLPILFIMNNSGTASSVEEMQKNTLEDLPYYAQELADQLGVPLLVPLVLREGNDLYPHELNRAVFVLQEGPFKRLDLQVLNMFKDARKQLKKQDIHTQKKMLVAGCSASGAFAWRWTMLHPEYVLATVASVDHYSTLPLEELNGEKLIYPIGVADVKQYTGRTFNKRAWQKIPIFNIQGGTDYNDPLPYDECYPGELRTLIHKLYDEEDDDTMARVRNLHKVLAQVAPNVQMHIYPNVGHICMKEDTVRFLRSNQNGGPIKRITPMDTSSWPPALPLHVSALYWGNKAPLTHDQKYLAPTDLTMKVQKSTMTKWIRKHEKCKIDVLQQDKEIIHGKNCNGIFGEEDFNLLQFSFTTDEVAKLKAAGKSTFSVRSHYPKMVDIPEGLTFTIK